MRDSALSQGLNVKAQLAGMVTPFQLAATMIVSSCEAPEGLV